MLHTPPLSDMREGRMCTAHCGCMWLTVKLVAMVKINRSLNLHVAPPSFHLKLRPHDLCFLALTPWHLTCACEKQTHPGQRGRLSLRHQRHSVVGVLTIQRAQSDWLPALPSLVSAKGSRADGRHLTLRKAVSEERPQSIGGESLPKSLLSVVWLKHRWSKERKREWEKERMRYY